MHGILTGSAKGSVNISINAGAGWRVKAQLHHDDTEKPRQHLHPGSIWWNWFASVKVFLSVLGCRLFGPALSLYLYSCTPWVKTFNKRQWDNVDAHYDNYTSMLHNSFCITEMKFD